LTVLLQTVKELCQPTSDWGTYTGEITGHQLTIITNIPGDEDQLNDENRETANALMTTKC